MDQVVMIQMVRLLVMNGILEMETMETNYLQLILIPLQETIL